MPKLLAPAAEFNVGSPIRQFRCVPFITSGGPAMLIVHSACAEVDPYHRMFFLPTDSLKLTAFSMAGARLWQRDLGGGTIPGIWFCPVLPFDLDNRGKDDIWLVAGRDADHPLDWESYDLCRLNPDDGATAQAYPWPGVERDQDMSKTYRNFINAAFSKGQRRLITCQGTYGPMHLQCWDSALQLLWTRDIARGDPGARGSHMFPVCDLDGDGRDELLWGERCIDIDTGEDLWIGDARAWAGHSDVIQPTLDRRSGQWFVYTCREAGKPNGAVVMFDARGNEVWGRRGLGHMDMGWTARIAEDGGHLCYALEIGSKTAGPGGFRRGDVNEYLFSMTGEPLRATLPLYQMLPVDFDGDGYHELMITAGERAGQVFDRTGELRWSLAGAPAYGGKLNEAAGEQIVTSETDGTVRIYACPEAEDSPAARARYAHPYYPAARRCWAMGYNRTNLGGL